MHIKTTATISLDGSGCCNEPALPAPDGGVGIVASLLGLLVAEVVGRRAVGPRHAAVLVAVGGRLVSVVVGRRCRCPDGLSVAVAMGGSFVAEIVGRRG